MSIRRLELELFRGQGLGKTSEDVRSNDVLAANLWGGSALPIVVKQGGKKEKKSVKEKVSGTHPVHWKGV